jgi:23S rRNA (cytidine1920-2'-O)/16S rRNA (cytidine1409-2'-O)-methyltransferase
VVREPGDRRAALLDVGECALALGTSVLGYASSGLPGPKGNLETFVWITERERDRGVELERAAREVEP